MSTFVRVPLPLDALAYMTEREVDEYMLAALSESYRARNAIDQAIRYGASDLSASLHNNFRLPAEVKSLVTYVRGEHVYQGRAIHFLETLIEAVEEAAPHFEHKTGYGSLESAYKQIEKAREEHAALRVANAALDDVANLYDQAPWQRYFLVTSSDGHIHSSMLCHTCNKGRKMTEFALLPSISAVAVETAVKALGPALCSVCFPDAPVEMTEKDRIPARVVLVLLEQGEEAFTKAWGAYVAKREAKGAACPGSGQYVKAVRPGQIRTWGVCPSCGESVTRTSTGLLRKHSPKKA